MQVSVETTQGLERRITITVPSENVETEVKKRLQQLSKTQRIDGFRAGKVPVSVINKRFGPAVRQEVAGEVMQRNYIEAIVSEKINPAGAPTFAPKSLEAGKDLEFSATFEVYPEVEVQGLDKITVEKPAVTVTDEDLANMLETLRKQHAAWADVDAAAGENDRVTVDFVGTIDGEVFEGGKAEDFPLELGQGRMIPGFEDNIVGKKAGEEVVADVTFPDDYHAENLKGKAAQFTITVKKVEAQELPELSEEFATKFGVTEGGVDALKEEVKKNMTRELDQAVKASVKDQAIKGLLANNEIEVPKALVDQEVDALRQQAAQRFGGDAQNMPELPAELFHEQAVTRVKTGLLLGEVIKANDIKVDDAKVEALIATVASAYEDPTEVVEYYKGNDQLMQQMRNVAMEEQAVEAILAKAVVTDVEKAFDDIMNPQQGA
ncbi:trigger factor [Pseudoalteromonas sp. SR43-6]|jgi:trigger factor|uniref:Trigger factor n=1 Tax=Pseudoalteromonas distincta TaxID=77608 RepID=F3BFD4_9GAMM|nr:MULTISPECIES: trigger factor [Pseudoalteromonas]EGI74815.1 cell division trigger factor [Pseudoalteromonas distincta]KAA1162356.1 trigger factor [Pseudoalteromonas distincta]MBB1276606.1 trigger factor [Pseudoalteromonas sp. SR43-3]MBB1289780.1 trigger factor [Pseudoalteromonas sp. SR41-5]MBB1295785.1 trigger factor [Pseudoalteromonas sp. SR41-7]|tara:strand:+ start:518 stop:1822 length:1305 start_codon:yes stop_codon:yes gene_type:complete